MGKNPRQSPFAPRPKARDEEAKNARARPEHGSGAGAKDRASAGAAAGGGHVLGVGQRVECEAQSLADGGRGVARVEGMAVFLDHALPGQRVEAVIERLHRRHAEARVVNVLSRAPGQVEPFCPHFGVCGGCDFQDLEYGRQLAWKRTQVAQALERLGGIADAPVEETVPSPLTRGFRNKMEFAFFGARGALRLGLRPRGQGDEVVDILQCGLMAGDAGALLAAAREAAASSGLPAYDPATGRGFWRFLVLRRNLAGQVVALVITAANPKGEQAVRRLTDALGGACETLGGVAWGIRTKRPQLAISESLRTIWGGSRFIETCAGLACELSAESFFQTNTLAAEKLVEIVRREAALTGVETLYDCCCGAGLLGLALAREAKEVIGFEVYGPAVADARANASRLCLQNVRFVAGDLAKTLAGPGLPRPDVVLADPPRAGLDETVVARLIDLSPERIVAVSCNPATLARDIGRLSLAYRLVRVTPVDLFPHSHHVESVALLRRK